MGKGDDTGIEVPAEDREAAARLQLLARVSGHLLAAVNAGLVWAVGPFAEGGAAVVVDGEAAFDGETEVDLVAWTRGRILGVAETAVAEAAAELLAEAEADQAAALGRYVREDVRGGGVGRGRVRRGGRGRGRGREAEAGSSGAAGGSGAAGEEAVARACGAGGEPGAGGEENKAGGGWAGRVSLTTAHAAEFLGLSPRTLEKWRLEGGGPVFHRLGRRVVYSREDLESWVAAGRRRSTSDPGPEE